MIKVLLAEDEKLIREGLKVSVEWDRLDLEIVGEASDGDEGFAMAMELKPDIILTDVRMPGMDGIEMARKILEISPYTVIIVISGYDDYEYMRQSLVYGFSDYLLKPIDDEELERVLRKAVEQVCRYRQSEREGREQQVLIRKSQDILKRDALHQFISGKMTERTAQVQEINDFISDYEIFSVVLLKAVNIRLITNREFKGENDIIAFVIDNICNEIAEKYSGLQFYMNSNKEGEVVFIKGINKAAIEDDKSTIEKLCQELIRCFRGYTRLVINIGIGESSAAEKINESYKQAVTALNELSYSDTFKIAHCNSGTFLYKEDVFEQNREMFQRALRMKKYENVQDVLEIIYNNLKTDGAYAKSRLHKNIYRYLCMTEELLAADGGEKKEGEWEQFLANIETYETLEDVWNWFVACVLLMIDSPDERQHQRGEEMDAIKLFIDQNVFSRDLGLEVLSKRFYMNPYRLSKLFKNRYKVNFQKYIIQKRIEKAAELLSETKIKVIDIAGMVGYDDDKYFSRIFKKYIGQTPNDYRKNHN